MEENQNGMYGGVAPRTYGEESRMYENQDKQAASQNYGQPNPYSQQHGQANQPNQQNQYSQPNPYSQQYGQANQQNQYSQPNQQYGYNNQQNGYNNQGYGQINQPYGAPTYQQPYRNGLGIHTPVKDIFCNILLVIMPLRMIISIILTIMAFSAIDGYDSILSGSYLTEIASGPYSILSMLSNLLMILYIVFVVLDVVAVNKGNYKILGLIMFAIFLNPGYYIWRAHILGRKKTIPTIYTVVYSILMFANFIVAFYYGFNLGLEMTNALYY